MKKTFTVTTVIQAAYIVLMAAAILLMGTSKNSDADESAESFPSYFTKFLRVAPTTRAKFCLI